MAKGAAWMVLMRLTIRAIGLASTVVLARLLVPGDFGLIALSTSIVLAVETLGQFSFDIALIRDARATRAHYDAAWTLGVIRGWVTAIAIAVCAVPIGELFHEPRLPLVLYGLAVATVVEGYQNIGIVDLRKDMQFRREFTFLVVQRVMSFGATIVLAVILREYWALLAGIVIGRIGGTVLSYTMSSYRPRHSLKEWRPLFSFSKWLLLNNILNLLSRADVYLIGRYFGAHNLGVYNVSMEISSLPSTELVAPIQRAIYPGFAKLAGDTEKLKRSYIDGLSILLMLAVPASTGIAVLADPIVRVLLGPNWLDAIPLLQIFSIHGLIKLGGGNAGSVLLAMGRPKVMTSLALLNLAILFPFLVVSINLSGLIGVAWALVATAGLNLVLSYVIVIRSLHISMGELAKAVWRSWMAAAIMAAVIAWIIFSPAPWLEHPAIKLAVGVPLGAITYVISLLGLWIAAGRPWSAEQITLVAIRQFRGHIDTKASTVSARECQ
jgi:O-antigen/teichoic acid export membrane protein